MEMQKKLLFVNVLRKKAAILKAVILNASLFLSFKFSSNIPLACCKIYTQNSKQLLLLSALVTFYVTQMVFET